MYSASTYIKNPSTRILDPGFQIFNLVEKLQYKIFIFLQKPKYNTFTLRRCDTKKNPTIFFILYEMLDKAWYFAITAFATKTQSFVLSTSNAIYL